MHYHVVENTPIDHLDFASPVVGLGSKLGIDATNKWPGETTRAWGQPIVSDAAVERRVDALWAQVRANRARTSGLGSPPGLAAGRTAPRWKPGAAIPNAPRRAKALA